MQYRRLCVGLQDKGKLVPADDSIKNYVDMGNPYKDYYLSLYKYRDEHKEQFEKTGSVSGISDLTVDKLFFDFDSKNDVPLAQADALTICNRLIENNVPKEDIQIYFSGNKGMHVEVDLKEDLNVDEFKGITRNLAKGLTTFDAVVSNPSRVVRGVGSVHKSTNYYKIPITYSQLKDYSVDQIKELAKSFKHLDKSPFNWDSVALTPTLRSMLKLKEESLPKPKVLDGNGIDWASKSKTITNCRYAIRNGLFEGGQRNNALLALAAFEKNQGSSEVTAYYVLKAAAKQQAERTGQTEFSKEEIWSKIISVVYSDNWKGGQYSCRQPGNWLYDYCQSLGTHKCNHKSIENLVTTEQVMNLFKDYTQKYESNVLFTGIEELDKVMKIMVGTTTGILAPPGVGKSSFSLQILEHNSNNDVPCLFYSYDMFHSALYMRMLQRQSHMSQDDIYKAFLSNPSLVTDHVEALNKNFKNVQFCFKSGQTIDELEDSIVEAEEKLGRKPKLVIVDYNELVQTDVSDPTSSSAVVAQRLRQIANEKEVAVITLLQPAKQYCSPADEITNFNSVKGSSSIVQSLTLLLGCSRPGFDPLEPMKDRFFNVTCLKNRNGPLFSKDFSWEGLTGKIGSLEDSERDDLRKIREDKKNSEKVTSSW